MSKNMHLSFAVVALPFLLGLGPLASAQQVGDHKPRFSWRDIKGEKWIYDGDMPVGALYPGPYPLCFHDLRLVPRGPIFIARNQFMSPLGIAWRNGSVFTTAIDQITADDKDPAHLRLYFKMHDSGLYDFRDKDAKSWQSTFEQETWLDLTYDPKLTSYVFAIRSRLIVRNGRAAAFASKISKLEYQDLLPDKCFDRFPPTGHKKWRWFVYRGPDGQTYKLPHTHHSGADKVGYRFCEDAIVAFVSEPEYNPVVELLGRTGSQTEGAICFWAWDYHFLLVPEKPLTSLTPQTPLEVNYRVYSVPQSQADALLEQSKLSPVLELPSVKCPAYVIGAANTFDPSDEYRQPSDKWFWETGDGNCFWDWNEGCKGLGSLAIKRNEAGGASSWRMNFLGAAYAPQPALCGRYRVHAMVKTEQVTGQVRLGWQFRDPVKGLAGVYDFRPMEYSAATLKGSNAWTDLTMETSDTGPAIWAGLYLIQEGSGQTWFDDIEITPISK